MTRRLVQRFIFVPAIVFTLMGTLPGWYDDGVAQAQAPIISGNYAHIGTLNHPVFGTITAGLGICSAPGDGTATCNPFDFVLSAGGGMGSINVTFTINADGSGTFTEVLTFPDGTTGESTSRFVITQVENGVARTIFAVQDQGAGPGNIGLITSTFERGPVPAQ